MAFGWRSSNPPCARAGRASGQAAAPSTSRNGPEGGMEPSGSAIVAGGQTSTSLLSTKFWTPLPTTAIRNSGAFMWWERADYLISRRLDCEAYGAWVSRAASTISRKLFIAQRRHLRLQTGSPPPNGCARAGSSASGATLPTTGTARCCRPGRQTCRSGIARARIEGRHARWLPVVCGRGLLRSGRPSARRQCSRRRRTHRLCVRSRRKVRLALRPWRPR